MKLYEYAIYAMIAVLAVLPLLYVLYLFFSTITSGGGPYYE